MGQSNSTESVTVETEAEGSGVGLSSDFEGNAYRQIVELALAYLTTCISLISAQILRDFQNQAVQDEWNKYRASILMRRNERLQHLAETTQRLQQQRQARAADFNKKNALLDETIDKFQSQFHDIAVALEYDVKRASERYVFKPKEGIELDSKPLPCLGERAHWMDCQKKYVEDTWPCHPYVEALEKCVNRAIAENAERLQAKTSE